MRNWKKVAIPPLMQNLEIDKRGYPIPLSAFHPQGANIDPPTHKDCGEYALRVCPYLAVSVYSAKQTVDAINAHDFNTEDNSKLLFVNPTLDPNRVPFFVFYRITGYQVNRHGQGKRYLIAKKPYLEVEFWNDGEKITREQAMELQTLKAK
jgi:hypothetical protein